MPISKSFHQSIWIIAFSSILILACREDYIPEPDPIETEPRSQTCTGDGCDSINLVLTERGIEVVNTGNSKVVVKVTFIDKSGSCSLASPRLELSIKDEGRVNIPPGSQGYCKVEALKR